MAEIVAFRDAYPHYLFAITPECGGDCQDGNFGVKSLSSRPGFLHGNDVAKSQLPNAIITSLGGIIDEFDAMKYMEVNYEAPRIQAEVMRATMPIARVVFFCPPCVTAITTAVNICKSQENAITEWRVRVDHRLGCACCHSVGSGLVRIRMIVDTILDVESGHHWAKPEYEEAEWMEYIDRAWLEQILYSEGVDDDMVVAARPEKAATSARDHRALGRLLTVDGRARTNTIAVILADFENSSCMISSAPFPATKRSLRAGEMIHLKKDTLRTMMFESIFAGTFAVKGALKRRREASPTPTTNKRKGRGIKRVED